MSQLDDLNERLSVALARIRTGLEARPRPAPEAPVADVPPPAAADPDHAALRAELDAERAASGELEARVEALKQRIETGARTQDRKRRQALSDLDGALQALQSENAELRQVAGELRAAAESRVADAELINRALQAEMDALRAARAAEAAEVAALLAELKPLLEEAS